MFVLRFTHLAPQEEDSVLLQSTFGYLHVKMVLYAKSSEDFSRLMSHRRFLKFIKYLSAVNTYSTLLALSSYFIHENWLFTVLCAKLKLTQPLM